MYKAPYPVVIGITGVARSGKDTVASAIVEARGGQLDIRRYAFADSVRWELEDMMLADWGDFAEIDGKLTCNALPPRALAERLCDKLGVPFDPTAEIEQNYPFTKQRSLLQFWGQKRRSEDPFYWIKALRKRIADDNPTVALVSDMRYRNERTFVKSVEGYTVLVEREDFVNDLNHDQKNHPSETELSTLPPDKWDYIVKNTTLTQLQHDAVEVFDKVVQSLSFPDMEQMLELAQAGG